MKTIFPFALLLLFCSCMVKKNAPGTVDAGQEKVKLLETDKDFSSLSEAKGMKHAFLEYMDSNAVLLKPGHVPIIGASAVDYLIQLNDTAYTLNWQPQNAAVSACGDLGYTYGLYALHPKQKDTVLYGTYVSIWKRQQDGKWKFVLDSGNEGVDEEE